MEGPPAELDDRSARCLFVISRDVSDDVSAAHLLRVALWDVRRGARVVVFLIDDAIGPEGPGSSLARLEALAAAGARLVASCWVADRLHADGERLGVLRGTDGELAALLREPGIRAVWC